MQKPLSAICKAPFAASSPKLEVHPCAADRTDTLLALTTMNCFAAKPHLALSTDAAETPFLSQQLHAVCQVESSLLHFFHDFEDMWRQTYIPAPIASVRILTVADAGHPLATIHLLDELHTNSFPRKCIDAERRITHQSLGMEASTIALCSKE